MEIGILGSGVVGRALASGLARHGHRVRIGTRRAEIEGVPSGAPAEVVRVAELVVLAVNGGVAGARPPPPPPPPQGEGGAGAAHPPPPPAGGGGGVVRPPPPRPGARGRGGGR